MSRLRAYPAYKDSGVEWLESVPSHWDVRRLSQIGHFSKGKGGSKEDDMTQGIPCVRYGDLYTTHQYFIQSSKSFVSGEKAKEYTPIKFGDVLFAASGETFDEIGKSAVNLLPSKACCGGDVILFRSNRKIGIRYLGYVTDCLAAINQKAMMGRGITVIHIYTNQLKRLGVTLPPVPEQTAIARFLDYATDCIDRYIHTKEKLISLLKEQKQVVIHQAVTGQIDVRTGQPYSGYKDSGIEWLGDVPVHWDVTRVKSVFTCLNHRRLPLSGMERGAMAEHKYDYYGASGVIDKVDDYLFDDELLLIAEDGANLVLRNLRLVIIASGKFWVNNHAHILKPKHGCIKYLAELLESLSYLPWISGAAQPKLTQDRLMGIAIAVPPRDEQDQIATYISSSTRHLSQVIARAQREVKLLNEYRERLISDVVTGKLDVREAAARLPQETDKLAPINDSDDLTDREKHVDTESSINQISP